MATTMTNDRKEQLLKLYEDLKKQIFEVEGKYSLESRVITIDFPPTLGLSKLTYTKHTHEEIVEIARQQTAAKYNEKNRVLANSYASEQRSVKYSRDKLAAAHTKRLSELERLLANALQEAEHKLTDNGLWESSIHTDALEEVSADYKTKGQNENTDYQNKDEAYARKLAALQEAYQSAKAQMEQQREEEVAALVISIAEKEESQARTVEKYNTSIDEKEAKYQASCARYTRYAQQAEEERVIAILKLYAQLGATGFEQRKLSDVLANCQSALSTCTKGEAEFIFSLDSFLQVHLGIYYSTLVDWAKTTLRPD